ncbi:MAG: energy-coupling factor ABC transporter ATP-binding protein [Thermoproteus sp.]
MRREVLKALGIEFGYYKEPVIKGADLSVGEGEVAAVYGPTGSGKTTLLLLLAGLLRPWRGEIYIMGEKLDENNARKLRGLIGVSFQNPDDMFFNDTVLDEIAYTPSRLYGAGEGLKAAREVAGILGITHLLDKPPYKLSGGQKRLVSLAAAIAHRPKLLILDEPTAYLDEETTERVVGLITKLKEEGIAIVLATHDLELICRVADRTYVLEGGRLAEGNPLVKRDLCICRA